MSLPQKVNDELLRIITIVKKKDIDRIFHEPVDVVKFGLTNYHEVVQFPMDLGTVEKKLKQHVYLTIDAVVADVAQIWKNSELYNGVEHSITLYGRDLDSVFQKKIAELKVSQANSPSPGQPRIRSSSQKSSAIKMTDSEQMSLDKKRKICIYINSLNHKDLAKIVHIIHKYQPDLFFDTDNTQDDIHINVEELETATLKEFEKMMNTSPSY